MTYIPQHFTIDELTCRCGCGFGSAWTDYAPELLILLDQIRRRLDRPVRVTSGARCVAHNLGVDGRPNSEHLVGAAADLAVAGDEERHWLLKAVYALDVQRVGIHSGFVHVGVSARHPSPRTFLY